MSAHSFEQSLFSLHRSGIQTIAGVDEAGRGALAGPVVAGACIMQIPLYRRRGRFRQWSPLRRRSEPDCLIADSKLLSPEERDIAFHWLTEHCQCGIGIADVDMIESQGILRATEQAMRLAIADLQRNISIDALLIDGRDAFSFDVPHRSIIRGDQTEPCIAAASILAKVTRDRLMQAKTEEYAHYGFALHKGYGTAEHIASLRKHGPSSFHRVSFLSRILPKTHDERMVCNPSSRSEETKPPCTTCRGLRAWTKVRGSYSSIIALSFGESR